MMNSIPRIDVYQMQRSQLKSLKIKGSQGSQANSLIEKSSEISRTSLGANNDAILEVTLTDGLRRKLNVI